MPTDLGVANPDVSDSGTSDPDTRPVRLAHHIELAFVRLLVRGLALGGRRFAIVASHILGTGYWLVSPWRRHIVRRNLEIAFGDRTTAGERRRIARRSFVSMFLTAFEVILRGIQRDTRWMRFEEDPALTRAYEDDTPRGLLLVSGHMGNWENGQWWCGVRGKPAVTLGRVLDNPLLERWIVGLRGIHENAATINPKGGLRKIVRVLDEGRAVALVVDQNQRRNPTFFPFFGVSAATHTVWAELAIRVRPRVVFCVAVRRRFGRTHLVARDLELPTIGTREEQVDALVRQYLGLLEHVIRQHPEQYLWTHRRFRTRPSGREPLYEPKRRRRSKQRRRDREARETDV